MPNNIYFFNLLHLHVSISADHYQGAHCYTVQQLQQYVHSSKVHLFTAVLSRSKPPCCTSEIESSDLNCLKMPGVIVSVPCGGQGTLTITQSICKRFCFQDFKVQIKNNI
jgi:hypothetical protein